MLLTFNDIANFNKKKNLAKTICLQCSQCMINFKCANNWVLTKQKQIIVSHNPSCPSRYYFELKLDQQHMNITRKQTGRL